MRRWSTLAGCGFAGAAAGSAVGTAEIGWLAAWGAGLDAWALLWAFALYGAVGGVAGSCAGGLSLVLARRSPPLQARSLAAALWAAWGPMILVVGRYVLNRDLHGEQGLSPTSWVALLVVAAFPLALLVPRLPFGPRLPLALGAGWLGIAGLLGGIAAVGPGAPDFAASLPPITGSTEGDPLIVVMVDTLRADALEGPPGALPAFDALRAESVVYANAWAPASWTRPSTASLWTSRLPSGHTASTKGSRLPAGAVTFAEVLRSHGYRTGALVNNINVTAGFGFDQGFDRFHYEEPQYPFGATEAVFSLALYKVLHRLEERVVGGGPVERYYQPADVVLGHAAAWLNHHRGRRTVLFVHLMEPHDPYFIHEFRPDGSVVSRDGYARAARPVPDASEAEALKQRYAGEVRALDHHLGRFIEGLRAAGLWDRATLVVTSDHGEEFHEHGGWWHGDTLFAEQTRVPLWIKLPSGELGGRVAPWRVRTIDVPPTLTALAGVPADPGWEGADLLGSDARGWLRGEGLASPTPADPAAVCRRARSHPLDRVVVQEEDFEGNVLWGVRSEGLALLAANGGNTRGLPERALFDGVADPGERVDLLGAGAPICATFPEDWRRDLEVVYRLELERSATDAASPEAAGGLSAAERARLCALGYLTGADCP